MATLKSINESLAEYTQEHCSNCYAALCEDGRLHLDDKFKTEHVFEILLIVEAGKVEMGKD